MVLNDKENDRIQKVLRFEGESGNKMVSWFAPNEENMDRILRPFRASVSGTSEESGKSAGKQLEWKRGFQKSEVSDSSEN